MKVFIVIGFADSELCSTNVFYKREDAIDCIDMMIGLYSYSEPWNIENDQWISPDDEVHFDLVEELVK